MRRLGSEQRAFLVLAAESYHRQLEASAFSTDALKYLYERGLGDFTVRYSLGVVDRPEPGHEQMVGRICIPYLTPAGPVDLKFRCIEPHDCKAEHCPKYLGLEGGGGRLFNARAVLAADNTVVITEGEFDAMAVSAVAGVPAVGYPGTDTWQRGKHFPRVFAGLDVVVVADGDKPGVSAAKVVAKSIPGSRVVHMPDGDDANSFLVREGAGAFRERIGVAER